jgi:hypothetical protein
MSVKKEHKERKKRRTMATKRHKRRKINRECTRIGTANGPENEPQIYADSRGGNPIAAKDRRERKKGAQDGAAGRLGETTAIGRSDTYHPFEALYACLRRACRDAQGWPFTNHVARSSRPSCVNLRFFFAFLVLFRGYSSPPLPFASLREIFS